MSLCKSAFPVSRADRQGTCSKVCYPSSSHVCVWNRKNDDSGSFNGYTCTICVECVFRPRPWVRNVKQPRNPRVGSFLLSPQEPDRYTRESRVMLAWWFRSAQTLQPEVTSSLFCWWDQRHWWQLFGSSGAAATPPDALKPCSSSNNCPIKFRLGLMIGRAFFTSLYASTIDKPLCRIMYAMAIVALRDTPAWQCTNTLLPAFRASSVREK